MARGPLVCQTLDFDFSSEQGLLLKGKLAMAIALWARYRVSL